MFWRRVEVFARTGSVRPAAGGFRGPAAWRCSLPNSRRASQRLELVEVAASSSAPACRASAEPRQSHGRAAAEPPAGGARKEEVRPRGASAASAESPASRGHGWRQVAGGGAPPPSGTEPAQQLRREGIGPARGAGAIPARRAAPASGSRGAQGPEEGEGEEGAAEAARVPMEHRARKVLGVLRVPKHRSLVGPRQRLAARVRARADPRRAPQRWWRPFRGRDAAWCHVAPRRTPSHGLRHNCCFAPFPVKLQKATPSRIVSHSFT